MKHLVITLVAFTTIACGGADTDLETAFCDGLASPAGRTVSASQTAENAADITDAARVDVRLAEVDGQYRGFVTYTPDEVGSFAFGLTDDVELVVRDAAGMDVPLEVTVEGAACDNLAVRHTVAMQMQTYTLEIGPADVDTIGVIAEESDDDR